MLSGPHVGTYIHETDNGETALKLLEHFIQHRWNWRLRYTDDEDPAVTQEWLQADLLARVMRAVFDGRGIRFAGYRWQCRPHDKEDGRKVLEQARDYSSVHDHEPAIESSSTDSRAADTPAGEELKPVWTITRPR
jgi:hypothetical protein